MQVNEQQKVDVDTSYYDVVVVGAGPYGLSAAAHLRKRGLKVAIFGKPLQLWSEYMPKGMLLRSYWWATNLSDPEKHFDLEEYFRETHQQPIDPLPSEEFIRYGLWFQKRVVPDVDQTFVDSIEKHEDHFVVRLVDGRIVQSATVVMAPGLRHYANRPAEYTHVSPQLVSHSSDCNTFERFAGKHIAVLGGGQGALETAALAHESGAEVEVISRSPIVWIRGSGTAPTDRRLIDRIRNPKAGISFGWFTWILEHLPYVFQQLPRATKEDILHGRGRFGPMGAAWLKPRIIGHVGLHESQRIMEMRETDKGVGLVLSNGTVLDVDHVILGTGYRVDISKLPMLSSTLLSKIDTYNDTPVLSNHFETSVSGLYFIGISSVASCGPLYRFVVGTEAAATQVAKAVARQLKQERQKLLARGR